MPLIKMIAEIYDFGDIQQLMFTVLQLNTKDQKRWKEN